MKEIWKDIQGYSGHYKVSNLGRVKAIKRVLKYKKGTRIQNEKILIPDTIGNGYKRVSLIMDGNISRIRVHRLVANAFIPNPNSKSQVNHKNGIKEDNRVQNLEWCTPKENMKHAKDNGLLENLYTKLRTPVIMLDLDNNKLLRFDSVKESAIAVTGKANSQGNICKCLKGDIKTAYGYKWKYAK